MGVDVVRPNRDRPTSGYAEFSHGSGEFPQVAVEGRISDGVAAVNERHPIGALESMEGDVVGGHEALFDVADWLERGANVTSFRRGCRDDGDQRLLDPVGILRGADDA